MCAGVGTGVSLEKVVPLGARTNVNTYAAVHGYVTHKAEHKKIVIVTPQISSERAAAPAPQLVG